MDTVSFLKVKRPGRGVHHPSTSTSEVREGVEIYHSPYRGYRVNFTFHLLCLHFVFNFAEER